MIPTPISLPVLTSIIYILASSLCQGLDLASEFHATYGRLQITCHLSICVDQPLRKIPRNGSTFGRHRHFMIPSEVLVNGVSVWPVDFYLLHQGNLEIILFDIFFDLCSGSRLLTLELIAWECYHGDSVTELLLEFLHLIVVPCSEASLGGYVDHDSQSSFRNQFS